MEEKKAELQQLSSRIRDNIIEAVKESFDKNGIEIPFNQLDVHIKERV